MTLRGPLTLSRSDTVSTPRCSTLVLIPLLVLSVSRRLFTAYGTCVSRHSVQRERLVRQVWREAQNKNTLKLTEHVQFLLCALNDVLKFYCVLNVIE